MLALNRRSGGRRLLGHAFAMVGAGAMVILAASRADAHFFLDAPPSWMSQTPPPGFGDPQKTGPCGDEGGGTPTGIVTRVDPQADGSYRVTVMWHDTIPHPGHYRIALAQGSRAELPPEPVVTPTAADQCASAAIVNPPYALPILADNINPHTATGIQGNQMVTVTIPASVSCTHCTLQVLEFMSSHGAPCFYHHCADLSMGAVAGTGGAAGGGSGGTAGRAGGTAGAAGTGGRGGGNATGGRGVVASGGAIGSGGSSTGSGGSTGAAGSTAPGSGGSNPGSGGATAGGTGGRAAAGDASADAASDAGNAPSEDGGCSCTVGAKEASTASLLMVGIGLVFVGLSRRRRRGR